MGLLSKSPKLIGGTVHPMTADMQTMLLGNKKARATWEDITPLARNEWICWATSAKQAETRTRRVRIAGEKLAHGERRPCCWAGCLHRVKNGK